MAYQALYRKYRPKTFKDVYGQEHITETLKNELATGTTVHAYLFTGTRGTGKTTCAKIFANAVNCTNSKNGEPCLECESCKAFMNGENTDIVEIDAASNNGVDSIRELRERINFAPVSSKYRVYIIDEVHMLSIGAFNALLKTLEEPPSHIIFILATTEVHKLPATILSRCQRFDFRRIDPSKICERLQFVAKEEGLTLTDSAATLIASVADGGMRDALSILDLCAGSSKNIDEATVESVCAMAGNDYLLNLAEYIKHKQTEDALIMLDKLHNSSVDMYRLLSELISHYRDLMIIKTVTNAERPIICSTAKLKALEEQAKDYDIKDIMFTLDCLQNSAGALQNGNSRCEMEMAIIKLCNPSVSVNIEALERRITALENNIAFNNNKKAKTIEKNNINTAKEPEDFEQPLPQPPEIEEQPLPEPPEIEEQPSQKSVDQTLKSNSITPVENWKEVVDILKTTCPLIAGVLGDSKAYIKDTFLLIDAKNSQFKSLIKAADGKYKEHIRNAAEQVLGVTYKLGPYSTEKQSKANDPLLSLADKLKNLDINR